MPDSMLFECAHIEAVQRAIAIDYEAIKDGRGDMQDAGSMGDRAGTAAPASAIKLPARPA
jgi:hypothetical protein